MMECYIWLLMMLFDVIFTYVIVWRHISSRHMSYTIKLFEIEHLIFVVFFYSNITMLTLTGLEGHICTSLVKGLEGQICPSVATSWWRHCDVI